MLNLVSRLAFETLTARCERLEAQNDRLLDMVWRLSRKEAGLSEIQPEQRRPPEEPFPAEVAHAIGHWDSAHIQAQRERSARACYRQTKDWNAVIELMALPQEEE